MSLHIDFIHDGERHDPVVQVFRTAAVAFAAFLAAGCAFYVLFAYLALTSANIELARARQRNDSLGPNVKLAVSLEKELAELRDRHGELCLISNCAFHVSHRMEALASVIPPSVQLLSLRLQSEAVPENDRNERFGRRYRGDISGCTAADSAETVVVAMIERMRAADGGCLGKVSPGGLNIDPGDPSSLLFDVRLDFGFFDCGSLKPSPAEKGGSSR